MTPPRRGAKTADLRFTQWRGRRTLASMGTRVLSPPMRPPSPTDVVGNLGGCRVHHGGELVVYPLADDEPRAARP